MDSIIAKLTNCLRKENIDNAAINDIIQKLRGTIYLMAHTPFRGGTDHHLGTDSPRREMFPAHSLYPILRLTPYKGLLG